MSKRRARRLRGGEDGSAFRLVVALTVVSFVVLRIAEGRYLRSRSR